MQRLQGEIWIEFADFIAIGVDDNTLSKGIQRNSPRWQAIADPADRRRRLIRYNTLADKYKDLIRTNHCGGLEPDEWLKLKEYEAEYGAKLELTDSLEYKLEQTCEDWQRLQHYYRGINGRQLKCLCRAAGIVMETANWYKKNSIAYKNYGPVKDVISWVSDNSDYFPLKYLPTNHIRLMEKIRLFGVDGKPLNEVIALPRQGNNNRATRKKEIWWQAVTIKLRESGKNLNKRAIYRKIWDVAQLEGLELPSESTVSNFLRETQYLTVASHTDLGNKLRQRHRASMPISKPLFADDCWEMDGTKVQVAPHKTGEGLKSLYIVAVRDVYSGAWLGYWYGYSESENAYRTTLEMAVKLTGRLPYELRYDRFPGHTSAGWEYLAGTPDKILKDGTRVPGEIGMLQKNGVKVTKTSAATGKASIERAFRTLQEVFESQSESYIGLGIKSHISTARPTEMYIARMLKQLLQDGWDFDQAWQAHADMIADFNHTPYSRYSKKYANINVSPWEMYEQAADESAGREVSSLDIAELFWNARLEGIRNNKIEFTVRGKRHTYAIGADYYELIRDYQREGVKVVVRHDAFDYSAVMVFNQDGEFLAELSETKDIQLYGRNADWKAAAEWKTEQKAIESKRKEDLKQYELPDEMALLLPTVTNKKQYNDAQKEYAYNNVGAWKAPEKKAKKEKPLVTEVDIDIDALTRSQY